MQEDVPEEFASIILNFISRNRIGPHGVEVSHWKHAMLLGLFLSQQIYLDLFLFKPLLLVVVPVAHDTFSPLSQGDINFDLNLFASLALYTC